MAPQEEVDGVIRDLPIQTKGEIDSFDIVNAYHRILAEDEELTMPVAAIEALIEALAHSQATTVSEIMDLVTIQSDKLYSSVKNPLPLSHGTQLFRRHLINSLRQNTTATTTSTGNISVPVGLGVSGASVGGPAENFEEVRQHFLRNSRLFAARAKESREDIAKVARRHIPNGTTILTHGDSRVVHTLLSRAAEAIPGDRARKFKVIYVVNEGRRVEGQRAIASLREKGIPVAVVPESAVSYCMSKVDMCIVGAEAVCKNGGILSRMGTYQIAQLAHAIGQKKFFVAAEQHKFGLTFPLNQYILNASGNVKQDVINFSTTTTTPIAEQQQQGGQGMKDQDLDKPDPDALDYTPPRLIESVFCNHGVRSTEQIANEIVTELDL